jgi:hypothetical protein
MAVIFSVFFRGSAEAPDTLWTRAYGGSYSDWGYSVRETGDKGFIIAGETQSPVSGMTDACLILTNSKGDTVWTRTFGETANNDCGYAVIETGDTGFVLSGTTNKKISCIRASLTGTTAWNKVYGVSLQGSIYSGYSLQQSADGGFIIAGELTAIPYMIFDPFILRTNSTGDSVWYKTYGGPAADCFLSIEKATDGGFVATGWTESFGNGDRKVYLVKINSNGDTLWRKTCGKPGFDTEGRSIRRTLDSGFIIAGRSKSRSNFDSIDVLLIRINANGDTLWTKTYGGDTLDEASAVCPTTDGGFIIAGKTLSFGAGNGDVYVVRTNANGDTLWTKTYGGAESDYASSVQQTADGGFIVVGTTQSFAIGGTDIWLIRIGKESTAMQDHLPHTVSCSGHAGLSWNEKNSRISIRYRINEPGAVKLAVYTARGRLVTVLVNTIMDRGLYETQWSLQREPRASASAGGVYFLALQTEGSFIAKKIIASKLCP